MLGDMIAPKATVSARDLLKGLIRDDIRSKQQPTLDGAVVWADQIRREEGWFVMPGFLLDVWGEVWKGEK